MSDKTFPPIPVPLPVAVYDNHTHIDLDLGYPETESAFPRLTAQEALDRASVAGVRGVVQVGTDRASSRWAVELAARDPRVLAAIAIHPNEAPLLSAAGELDDALAELDLLANGPRVRAMGETGLDFFRTDDQGRPAQVRSFEAHIELAKQHGLAVQIHDRDAHAAVVETLLRVGAPERTVFHCFSGDAELAGILAEHGWYASFAGTVTFKNAGNLREALAAMPRELILVETDAPFLAPAPHRGRPNSAYTVPYTVRFMADELQSELDILCAQLASNTESVYGLWS